MKTSIQRFPVRQICAAVTLALGPSIADADPPSFRGLGTGFYPVGLSADGTTVVGATGSGTVKWTETTGWVYLGPFRPSDVSADGSVVVGWNAAGQAIGQAIRWTPDGEVTLGVLPGYAESVATAVSGNGEVVVGTCYILGFPYSTTEAFFWSEATGMVGLEDVPGGLMQSSAAAVSDDGSVVAGNGVGPPISGVGMELAVRWSPPPASGCSASPRTGWC